MSDWMQAALDHYAPPPPQRRWPTPGALAKHLDPRTVQTPALDLIDAELVRLRDTPDGRLIISMPPQEGKALALDTPIPTPTGWTTMGALRVGDAVIGGDGHPCQVTWVSPVWSGRDCYAVTTGDGERIVADAAHEWVARLDRRRSLRIVETAELARPRNKNAQILTAPKGLELPEADLPLDPYVFGVWLGDGTTSKPEVTSHPDDTAVRERMASVGWPLRYMGRMRWSMIPDMPGGTYGRGSPSPAKAALRNAGVLGDKHIPNLYLRASRTQRLALLQGLVDSDGYVGPGGQVEFCATNKRLAEGVRELVYSLGAKAVMGEGRATIAGRDCGTKYRVRFYMADAAYLPRKAAHCKDSSVASVRYVKAEPCESAPTVCIEVDSPDHTFLAGRTMLPTHNSTRVSRDFVIDSLIHAPDTRVVMASYSQDLANRNGRSVRNLIASHPDLGIRIADDHGAASEWSLSGHQGGVKSVGRGAGVVGRAADMIVIDDPLKDRAEADSETIRETCWSWWTESLSTRLAPGAPVVLILTRWHSDDLAGRLLAAEDGHLWRVINIPAQADHDPAKGETDPLGREPGEFMISARDRTAEQWEAIKVRIGTRGWNAQYQGRPTAAQGDIFHRDWWQEYQVPLWLDRADGSKWATGMDEVMISADLAFKDTAASDYVAMGVWGRRGVDCYLLDLVNERLDFVATCQRLRQLAARWPQATLKLVEDKANGPAVIAALRRVVPGIIPEEPQGSKVARATAVSPLVEAGNVHLPSPELAPWVSVVIDQCAGFPNAAHDDVVDQLSQALNRLILQPLLAGQDLTPQPFRDLADRGWTLTPY